jgi:hypothetical protein
MPSPETGLYVAEMRSIPFKLRSRPIQLALVSLDPDTITIGVENVEIGHVSRLDGEDNFAFATRARTLLRLIDETIVRIGQIEPEPPVARPSQEEPNDRTM